MLNRPPAREKIGGFRFQTHDSLRKAEQCFPQVGQLDLTAATVKQLDVKIRLQTFDLGSNRWLSDVDRARCGGETPFLGDSME